MNRMPACVVRKFPHPAYGTSRKPDEPHCQTVMASAIIALGR